MKPKLLLRIAAAIIFLHALAHTMGVYTWKNTNSHVPQDLIKQMTEQKFAFMGTTATMAAFYDGFGYASTIAMLLIVAILWILGSAPKKNAALSAKILWPAAALNSIKKTDENFIGLLLITYYLQLNYGIMIKGFAPLISTNSRSKINSCPAKG